MGNGIKGSVFNGGYPIVTKINNFQDFEIGKWLRFYFRQQITADVDFCEVSVLKNAGLQFPDFIFLQIDLKKICHRTEDPGWQAINLVLCQVKNLQTGEKIKHIADILDQETQEFIEDQEILQSYPLVSYWIGGSDTETVSL